MRATGRELMAPLVLGVALICGWWLTTSSSGVPGFLLPSPVAVVARLGADLGDSTIWHAVGVTVSESVGGAALGTLVALPLAIIIHRSSWVSAAVQPFLGATQAIPAIALAPLLVLWVGYGLWGVVTLCALMVFFPILIAAVLGLRHVPRSIVEAARIDGAGSLRLLSEIELPLALPSVLAGLRNGFTLSVTGAVVGEMVMGGNGLGSVLTVQRDAVDTVGMFASIIVLCLIASTAYTLIHVWERHSAIIESLR